MLTASKMTDNRVVSVGMMADNLAQYFRTQNDTNGTTRLWSLNTQLWPCILVLVVGLISGVLAAIVLTAYFWGAAAADRWDNRRSKFTNTVSTVKIALAAVAAASMFVTG